MNFQLLWFNNRYQLNFVKVNAGSMHWKVGQGGSSRRWRQVKLRKFIESTFLVIFDFDEGQATLVRELYLYEGKCTKDS